MECHEWHVSPGPTNSVGNRMEEDMNLLLMFGKWPPASLLEGKGKVTHAFERVERILEEKDVCRVFATADISWCRDGTENVVGVLMSDDPAREYLLQALVTEGLHVVGGWNEHPRYIPR